MVCNGSSVLFAGFHGTFNDNAMEVSPLGIAKNLLKFAGAPVFANLLIFVSDRVEWGYAWCLTHDVTSTFLVLASFRVSVLP